MNILVLTTGLSGSSLITGLIARAGADSGETVVKQGFTGNYDTHENHEFVELNAAILHASGEAMSQLSWYEQEPRKRCASLHSSELRDRCRDLLMRPHSGSAVLKDPKLWMTIGFWEPLLDPHTTKTLIVYRDPVDLWVSQTNKRIIYDFPYIKRAETESRRHLMEWLDHRKLSWLALNSTEFLQKPVAGLGKINDYLGTSLTLTDYEAVYRPRATFARWKERLLAVPIYAKNYRRRIKPLDPTR